MPVDLCEHLDDYGRQYATAEAAYRQMLGRLEVVMREERGNRRNIEHLEDAVEEWEREVRYLRELFTIYVRRGDIEIPGADDAGSPLDPVCGSCGELVPRLRWQEWRVGDEGASFRGAPFQAASVAEPAVT